MKTPRAQENATNATELRAGLTSHVVLYVVVFGLASGWLWSDCACAYTSYHQHSFFDNSLTPDAYYYSSGRVSAPSTLALVNGKLPVDGKVFLTPPNALRLEWQSLGNGGWEAQVDVMRFRNRGIRFHGDMLFLWCFSPEGIPAAALPWNQADARSCGVRLDVGPLNVGRLMPFEVVQFILRLLLYFRLDVAEEF